MSAPVAEQPGIGTALLPAFRQVLAERGRSASTCAAYATDLELFRSWLRGGRPGEPAWARLPGGAFAAYLTYEANRGRSAATLCRKGAALRAFCAWLEEEGMGPRGLARSVPRRLGRAAVDTTVLDEASLGALCAAPQVETPSRMRDAALLALLCTTGLRVTEAVCLDVEDLGLAALRVRTPGRADHPAIREPWRLVVLEEETRAALARYVGHGRAELLVDAREPALFVNVRGQRLTRQGAWLRVMAHGRAAGVGASVSPGLLRRSAALAQLRRGTPPAAVAERLGCTSSTWLYRLRGSLAAGKRP